MFEYDTSIFPHRVDDEGSIILKNKLAREFKGYSFCVVHSMSGEGTFQLVRHLILNTKSVSMAYEIKARDG